ncbi:hemophore-related protein [Nocardia sp. CA-151230]|uniref:hemophore-related protein n=1 Tax=Nocardia sp. CA-151230 TaxID=3239982 RepID=UPI003D92F12A
MTSWTRHAAAALAVTGICSAAVLSGTGVAAADDDDSLTRSTCSWAQIDATLEDQDPVLARLIDGHLELTSGLAVMYQLPPEARPESFFRIVSQYPDVEDRIEHIRRDHAPGSEPVRAKFDRVADTCHRH